VRYYLDLYFAGWQNLLKTMSQYRADFMIMSISALIHDGATLLFIDVIFNNVRDIQGWGFSEVVFIYGLMITTRSVWNSFLDVPHRIHRYVHSGELDGLLVKPPSVLFHIVLQTGFNPSAFGRIVVGVVALVIAMGGLDVSVAWWWFLYLPLVVISGSLLMFGAYLMLACLSFWFTNVQSLLATVAWCAQLGQFPATIYALPIKFLLTWVLPFAMLGFYPAAFLLRGDEYRVYGLVAPLIGLVFFGLGLLTWRVAIRHYQSTGS
jgi:ABC-2 type transport system permease protein